MERTLGFLVRIVLSLLPERYRSRLGDVDPAAAFASGVVELQVFLFLSIFRYLGFFQENMDSMGQLISEKAGEGWLTVQPIQFGLGVAGTIEYVFHPASLVLLGLAFEGLVRAVAAGAAGEALPSFPLAMVAAIHGSLARALDGNAFGRRIADEVETDGAGEYDLVVHSCRPKAHWNRWITVRFRGEFYQLVREDRGRGPRPFRWYLRKSPPDRLVGTVYAYRPEDVLDRKTGAAEWRPT